jgi:hypothetical protein
MLGDNPEVRTLTVRLSDQDGARLDRLQRMTGKSQKETIATALVHLLGTLEAGGPVFLLPPSEVAKAKDSD